MEVWIYLRLLFQLASSNTTWAGELRAVALLVSDSHRKGSSSPCPLGRKSSLLSAELRGLHRYFVSMDTVGVTAVFLGKAESLHSKSSSDTPNVEEEGLLFTAWWEFMYPLWFPLTPQNSRGQPAYILVFCLFFSP